MKKLKTTIRNIAQCLLCGDIIESKHRHDYVSCKCGNLSVDGGKDYFKRNFANGVNSYRELNFLNDEENKESDFCYNCNLDNPSCDKCIGS